MTPLRFGDDSAFAAEHRRLMREAVRRSAPLERPAEPVTSGQRPEAIGLARENWRARMAHEHRSAAVFAELVRFVMAAGAPPSFHSVMARMALDELLHAELCGEVVAALGGAPEVEQDTSLIVPLPLHADCTPLVAAARNVLFACCLSETISMALLAAELERTNAPYIVDVVRQLASDEVTHARFGWEFLAWAAPRMEPHERDQVDSYLPRALAAIEREMLAAMPVNRRVNPVVLREAEQLGLSPSKPARELLSLTLTTVIVPRLDDLGFAATPAWERRG
ncbi:MAG: ferritin-like domain-containing protein [Myxococcales bacterium]|nr:ferritin-like domain-containing protein [Myxococcales bacterium]